MESFVTRSSRGVAHELQFAPVMTPVRALRTSLPVLLAALACSSAGEGVPGGDPQPGNAYLTIVGDTNVFLEYGGVDTLTVKYHDQNGDPLAGDISFRIDGGASGSALSATSDVTDSGGRAQVTLTAGQDQISFRVIAEAEYADPVEWRVAVSQGAGALDIDGRYALDSQFDLAFGLTGDAGNVINTFLEMTDGPNDPASWIIDQTLDSLGSSILSAAIQATRPVLDTIVNEVIRQNAPNLIVKLRNLGNHLGDAIRRLGMHSELTISEKPGSADPHVATHAVTGFHWTIDGAVHTATMAELDLGEIKADNVLVTQGPQLLDIADHTLGVPYGELMVHLLNHVLVPAVEPFANSLEELFVINVNCYEVGWRMYWQSNTGTPQLYEAACVTALAVAANAVEEALRTVDLNGASFRIHGETQPVDTNGDSVTDRLMMGLWEGTFRFGGLESALTRPNQKFLGERMGQ